MVDLFADLPVALENNYNFPFRCNFRPLSSKPILPNISSDKGVSADEILKKNSLDGLNKKFIKLLNLNEKDFYKAFVMQNLQKFQSIDMNVVLYPVLAPLQK